MSDTKDVLFTELTLSHGEYHYRVRLNNFGAFIDRRADEAAVMGWMYKALNEFHERRASYDAEVTKLKSTLWTLAGDRPDLIPELKLRGLL